MCEKEETLLQVLLDFIHDVFHLTCGVLFIYRDNLYFPQAIYDLWQLFCMSNGILKFADFVTFLYHYKMSGLLDIKHTQQPQYFVLLTNVTLVNYLLSDNPV